MSKFENVPGVDVRKLPELPLKAELNKGLNRLCRFPIVRFDTKRFA